MKSIVIVFIVFVGSCKNLQLNLHPRQQKQYPSPTYYCPANNPSWNKLIAMQVLQDVRDLNPANLGQYIHPDYIQHWYKLADGLGTLQAALMPGGVIYNLQGGKPSYLNFEHVGAEGSYVWLHLKAIYEQGMHAQLELYRFECGKIKEHWTVSQAIDPSQPVYNTHPYF